MTARGKILIVDDDTLVRKSIARVLERAGFAVVEASHAEAALVEVKKGDVALVLLDVRLPGLSGDRLLPQFLGAKADLLVIMMTAYGSIEAAVDAIRQGARDYLAKPLDDFELLHRIERVMSEDLLVRENRQLKQSAVTKSFDFVSSAPSMRPIQSMIDSVAPTRATVLMRGESGTGKTMIARIIHARSDRATGPFVEVSCGALPDPLLESELFGHERGAFTGADRGREGKFEAADGGTLFLDEIANASFALQAKLLRVIQERSFERLGGNDTKSVDVRLILATNADLEALVKEGKFREDLYYRIHVITIAVPPLRDRKDDIAPLAKFFVDRFSVEHRRVVKDISPDFFDALFRHRWPGNVRELENVVEHAVIMAKDGRIDVDSLPSTLRTAEPSMSPQGTTVRPLREALEEPEKRYIMRALALNDGNRQKTAEMLDVNRTTLFYKMKKYGLLNEKFS